LVGFWDENWTWLVPMIAIVILVIGVFLVFLLHPALAGKIRKIFRNCPIGRGCLVQVENFGDDPLPCNVPQAEKPGHKPGKSPIYLYVQCNLRRIIFY